MSEPRVGDEGQRYEVKCLDGDDKEMVMGWTDDSEAFNFKKSVELHPMWHDCTVIDRRTELNYDAIRAAAEKATKGKRYVEVVNTMAYVLVDGKCLLDVTWERDLQFEALTDPTTIIALCDENKRLRDVISDTHSLGYMVINPIVVEMCVKLKEALKAGK